MHSVVYTGLSSDVRLNFLYGVNLTWCRCGIEMPKNAKILNNLNKFIATNNVSNYLILYLNFCKFKVEANI